MRSPISVPSTTTMIGRIALLALVASATAVGVLVAVHREDPLGAPIVGTPTRSDSVEGWACPAGTVGNVLCGYVDVPAADDDPEIDRIKIFVARVSPPIESTRPPLVFLGELGRANVTDLADWRTVARELDREIVLIDHRGTGSSEPGLRCPEFGKVSWLEGDLEVGELSNARSERIDVASRCLDRLAAAETTVSLDLAALVADVERVRIALDIDRWTVAASGPSVPLALAVEATSNSTESLVLLRAAPATADPLGQAVLYGEDVIAAALGCGGSRCSFEGATLRGDLFDAIDSIQNRSFVYSASLGDRRTRVQINSSTVFPVIARAVVDDAVRESLQSFARRGADGDWRDIAGLRATQFSVLSNPSIALRLATSCEVAEVPGRPALVVVEQWGGLIDDPLLDPDLCRPSDQVRALNDRVPSVPTLVLNQVFDSWGPARAAAELRTSWPEAIVLLAESGDAPSLMTGCISTTVADFLNGESTIALKCD